MSVENLNACHGKSRHVDKDWRTVYGGSYGRMLETFGLCASLVFLFLCLFPSRTPDGWLRPWLLPLRPNTRHIASLLFKTETVEHARRSTWIEHHWSPA